MMKHLLWLLCTALIAASAADLNAGRTPTFQAVNVATKAAVKSEKPLLIVAGATVPKSAGNPRDRFQKLFKDDKDVAERADKFELSFVEAYSPSDCNNGNYCISPAVRKRYGAPLAVTLWAPTGQAPIWQKTLSEQTFDNGDPEISGAELAVILDTCLKAWESWGAMRQKVLEDAGASKVSDKKLKTPSAQRALAEYYAHGFMAAEAEAALIEAGKLAKKAAKDDPSMAGVEAECAYRAAEIYAMAKLYVKANELYSAFAKDFKESSKAAMARFLAAEALARDEKYKEALKELEKILGDEELASVHSRAKDLVLAIVALDKK